MAKRTVGQVVMDAMRGGMDAAWEESKHPRDKGKFAPKGSGTVGAAPKKPTTPQVKNQLGEWVRLGKTENVGGTGLRIAPSESRRARGLAEPAAKPPPKQPTPKKAPTYTPPTEVSPQVTQAVLKAIAKKPPHSSPTHKGQPAIHEVLGALGIGHQSGTKENPYQLYRPTAPVQAQMVAASLMKAGFYPATGESMKGMSKQWSGGYSQSFTRTLAPYNDESISVHSKDGKTVDHVWHGTARSSD